MLCSGAGPPAGGAWARYLYTFAMPDDFPPASVRPRALSATLPALHATDARVLAARRRLLGAQTAGPVVLASGTPLARNFPANTYPFRAASHFLYLVGRSIPHAALLLVDGHASLFIQPAADDYALWHGPTPTFAELGDLLGLAVRAADELPAALGQTGRAAATLPPQDEETAAWLTRLLGRAVVAGTGASLTAPQDAELADAMIAMRLVHDDAALAQLRTAAHVSARAHVVGMRATRAARTEARRLCGHDCGAAPSRLGRRLRAHRKHMGKCSTTAATTMISCPAICCSRMSGGKCRRDGRRTSRAPGP